MKFLAVRKDGGPDSNVTGYWLFEIKSLFSMAILRFRGGSREAYHSHAFHSISWVLKGKLLEERLYLAGQHDPLKVNDVEKNTFLPSLFPIITTRSNLHKVYGCAQNTWVLTFRGPWSKNWIEAFDLHSDPESKCLRVGRIITLTHGRKVVESYP